MAKLIMFSKQDISNILDISISHFRLATKKIENFNWQKKKQYFDTLETFEIIKKIDPLRSDEEIKALIRGKKA
jgi:hypothetical protein